MYGYFEVEWLERVEAIAEKAIALKQVVNKHARDDTTHWNLFLGRAPCDEFSVENIEKAISSFTTIRFDRLLASGFGVRTERISACSGIYGPYLPTGFVSLEIHGIEAELHRAPELFKDIVSLFEMPFVWHLPDFGGAWSQTSVILEAALQRDFSWGWLDSRIHTQQIAVAKSLAALLPRIGHVYDNPGSTGIRLPQRLGWLNCWSAEVAEQLGFPDPGKDIDILPLCTQLRSGHWIVQLTEDPLDLRRSDHAEAIVRAYWRFEKIGRRSKPATKKTVRSNPAPADAGQLRTYVIHVCDASGNWWRPDYPPIEAGCEDDALRIYFCKLSRGRNPRPHETLSRLRKTYDAVVLEVEGLPQSDYVEARLKE